MDRPPDEFTIREVDWDDADALGLRDALSAEVGPRYDDDVPDSIRQRTGSVRAETVHRRFLVVTDRDEPVGHAALRWNRSDLELKRMYVRPEYRGSAVATLLLQAAEAAAHAACVTRLILQTGYRQPDAVRF